MRSFKIEITDMVETTKCRIVDLDNDHHICISESGMDALFQKIKNKVALRIKETEWKSCKQG